MIRKLRYSLLVLLGIILVVSCSNNNGNIIPQKDMVKIFTKIYLTDGVLGIPGERKLISKDTIEYYEPIIQSYGYTTVQFDSSIKFYAQHTDKFDEIFDRVIIELSKMDETLTEKLNIKDKPDSISVDSTQNLWPHKTYWDMAIDYNQNPSLGFDVPVKGFGKYIISFNAQIFPDDQSEDTRLYIFFYYDDKTPNGNRTNAIITNYPKDSLVHTYKYSLELNDPKVTHLSGWLYSHSERKKEFKRHAIFSNLVVNFVKTEIDTVKTMAIKPKFLKKKKEFKKALQQAR